MTDMSQNEQPSRAGFLRLVGGSVQDSWSRLRRRCASAAQAPAAGTASPVPPAGAGATSLWLMRTTVREEPGVLAGLCTALARERIDIVSLQTFPLGPGGGPAQGAADAAPGEEAADTTALYEQTVDEFVLRAPRELEAADLHLLVTDAGGRETWLERAHEENLVDIPTRVLRLATRTALDSAELPVVLRQLLGRCTIRSVPPASPVNRAPAAETDGVPPEGRWEGTKLRLPDPAGGVLIIERPQLPFTPSEFARARALVDMDRQLGAGKRVPDVSDRLELPEGQAVTVRRAGSDDVPAALAMHARCSGQTLARRYHGPVSDADSYLSHLLSPRFGRSLAVETAEGDLVALGHLLWDGEETEAALVVEDAWQHRGIGRELLRRLAGMAAESGASSMYAVTQASNTAMVASMRGLGLPLDYQIEEGTLVVTAQLAGVPAQRAVTAGRQGPR